MTCSIGSIKKIARKKDYKDIKKQRRQPNDLKILLKNVVRILSLPQCKKKKKKIDRHGSIELGTKEERKVNEK